jgi:hypothetical protein
MPGGINARDVYELEALGAGVERGQSPLIPSQMGRDEGDLRENLLYGNIQVHTLVNSAIQMESSCGGEWTDRLALTNCSGKAQVNCGRAGLFSWLLRGALPLPIGDGMG